MVVKEYFIACEEVFPEKKAELRRISVALRREGILTMEDLCARQRASPQQMTQIRNVGEKSTRLIAVICRRFESNEQLTVNNEQRQ